MSIFTSTGYCKKYCILHPWEVVIHKIRDIHCAIQRARKGYCYRDLWNIDVWFLDIMPRMIDEFIKIHHGYPCDLTSEEWEQILNRMSTCFKDAKDRVFGFDNPYFEEMQIASILENEHFKSTLSNEIKEKNNEIKEKYNKYEEEQRKIYKQNLEEGLDLFKTHFNDLWD